MHASLAQHAAEPKSVEKLISLFIVIFYRRFRMTIVELCYVMAENTINEQSSITAYGRYSYAACLQYIRCCLLNKSSSLTHCRCQKVFTEIMVYVQKLNQFSTSSDAIVWYGCMYIITCRKRQNIYRKVVQISSVHSMG